MSRRDALCQKRGFETPTAGFFCVDAQRAEFVNRIDVHKHLH